ncbi:hypothetical protein [Methylibium rhizosphaerae]|uniref:hypothetical protein n=1 Tax=Methylibium rhizosphaerae TaxID=2570323 RepID=UPI00112E7606|nr:hypothetical protein [Methylibium rhizosphaerae]
MWFGKTVCLATAAVTILAGCGGGNDNGCEQTGTVTFHYAPSIKVEEREALTYRLGQSNAWTLTVQGVTQACLAGLKAVVPAGRPALPASLSLDVATGTISSGVLNSHIEGYCTSSTGTVVGPSTNRTCAAGQTYNDQVYVLQITSDHVNNTAQVPTPISFAPRP